MGRDEETGHQKVNDIHGKVGFLALPEAPVFYPSEAEFTDPLNYIEQIRSVAEPYGICRIVPPESWNPPFAIDKKSFAFPTKLQEIHQLQMRPAARDAETFRLEYCKFLEKEGLKPASWPSFLGKELDLCKLFGAVKRHGGYQKVMKENKWGEVLQILDPSYTPAAQTNSLQSALCKMYEAHLHAYETHKSSSARGKRSRNSNVQEAKFGSRGRKAGRRCTDEFEALKGEEVSMDDTDSKADQVCEQCHTGAHEQLMLLCDRCDRGWHLYCLTPPLSAVPPGNWYCFDCLTSETESFGFTPGEVHDFESFRRVADRFKKKWFGTKEVTASEIEEEFWSVVERCKGPVEVLYGSDLASEVYGSGFPRISDPVPEWADESLWKHYASSPWNLNNFTKLKGSVLKHVQENIPGVTVPWVYMGMLFSSFCWHYEDQCFYSINYLHWGEPKCWYGVPGSAINSFEQVMHKTFPDLFEAQPDLLFQLVTMLNPKVLCEHDVPVYTTIQERGNFVITFPRSYHGGFNHGLNCAEAVNFATLDWLPLGRFGVERARLYHKAAVLSHEELLCVTAKNADGYKKSSWLKDELTYMIALEKKQRIRLWRAGIIHSSRMVARQFPEVIGTEEDPVCIICRYYLFMSALTCSCCPGKAVCLQHSEQLCECSKDRQRLLYRYSLAELEDLQLEVQCPDIDQSPLNSGLKGRHRRRYKQSEAIMSMKKVNGGIVSLSKLADTWLVKAEDVISKTPKLSSVQNLLVEAEEFLWAGHEMDRLRSVEKELQSAESWAQGVAACLNAAEIQAESKEANLEKGSLTTAQELLAVNPAPCGMKDSVSKLRKFVAVAIHLQKQVKVLLSSSPPWKLSDLEQLQEKVVQSPLLFSEAKELEDIVTSIKAWRTEVQNILSEPQLCVISGKKNATDMNKLYKLQLEAQKLPVSMPELQALDVFVSKLENWQERAKALMQTVVPLQVAEKLLMEIENVPVYFTEAEVLQRRLYRAKEWIKSTHKVLADIHHQSYYSASIEMLLSLVKLGESLKLEVKEIDLIKAELKKLLWLERAAKVLEHQSTCKELMDMLEEATELSLQDEKLYLKLSQVAEAAAAWERRASKILLNGGSLDEYRSLRRDSSKIYVSLSGWVGINASIMQAESFLHHAQPFLDQSQHSNSILKLELLQDVISQSCSLRVHLPERDHLCAVLADVKAWRNKAMVLMNSAKGVLQESHFNNTDLSLEEKSTMIIKSKELIADLRNVVDGGQIFRFELPEIAELKVLVTGMEWYLKVSQSLLEYPTIQELDCLVQEATAFRDYVGQLELLRGVLRKGKEWSMKVRSALELNGSSLRCTVQDLESLISEAKAMKINLSKDVTYLQQLLMSHRSWLKKISQYLFPPNLPVSWQELCHFQAIRKTHPIACDEADLLEKELLKSEAWVLKCFNKLLGKSEGISFTLIELLSKVRMSVDCALQQLHSKASEQKEKVCRLCRKHVDAASFSCLKCDNCKDSYHGLCLGFDNSQERGQKQFVCSFCNAFTAGILWLDEGILSKICITKRPTVGALQDLLEAGKGINIRMEEIQLLQGIVRRVQAWHTCLHEIIEPVLRPHSNETYSSSSLLSALKIAGTMEVQGDGNSKLALALSVNAWRMHARSIMESSTKPSYRTVCRILKEGLAIPCLSHDSLLKDLESWESMASEWVNEANKAIEDNGRMPLEDVLELIVEGERLPVAFSKEIADLRSRTVLYCICRKPYDKDRAMIACDSCSEWYHFDCVNLPDPDSSDDECEAMLQRYGSSGEFLCPNCKPVDSRDSSSLIKLVDQRSSNIEPVKELNDISQKSLYTPPLWYARGKRSSRSSVRVRAGLQERWQSYNKILYCSEGLRKGRDRSKTSINSSGRPCRRTAGQHSRFESFVLLMHSG